jgi:AGZA family xanthine/uracil permease-like MFS transporter
VVKLMGYPWQTALGAVFIGGCVFILLTVLKVRGWLTEGIPPSLKHSFVVGIGLFLTFIGLNQTGLVVLGVPGAPVHVGKLTDPKVLLAVFGLALTGVLMIRRVTGAILIGIVATTLLSMILGVTPFPSQVVGPPPSLEPIFLKLDIRGALRLEFIPVILAIFIMDFLDTMGTLIALASRADLLDEKGNLPEIEKPMLADAIATTAAGLLGTTASGAYLESASGIAAGGRTGLTALVVALLFLLSLFLAPFLTVIPSHAYGPSLIIVGSMMLAPIRKVDFDDLTEYLPAFLTIALMCFTYHIGIGMTAGFILYPLFKLVTGRAREIHPGMWILTALSVVYYLFQVE